MIDDHARTQYATTDRLAARIAIHRYGRNSQPWHNWVLAHLPLHQNQRIVEVGAGTGALWAAADLDALSPELALTDASPAMCETLRGQAFPRASVTHSRAEHLPFPDGDFDGAVANHMLYHLPDPAAALAELHRVLRPGGWLSAATNGKRHMAELDDIAAAAGVPIPPTWPRLTFRAENGPALVAELFTAVEILPCPDELLVPTAAPVVAYIASLADEPLTEDQTEALRVATEDVIRTHGAVRITKETVLILARKPA